MPWIARQSRGKDARLRGLRRWRYDHSEQLLSLGIGASVVAATVVVLMLLKLVG